MNLLRKSLFPLSLLYEVVTRFRNVAFDKQWFRQSKFDIPTIVIGNLITGGSGKTPMIAYLLHHFSDRFSLAVLSRGYKRKSSGFLLANPASSIESLGDEPFLLFQKFSNVQFAVCKNRPEGIRGLLQMSPQLDAIFLDDGFQHRKLKPSFQILLTPYDRPWFRDCVLPAGNLRESPSGRKRADLVIVTKCTESLSKKERENYSNLLALDPHQNLFFTSIQYDENVYGASQMELKSFVQNPFVLVTGIANAKPLKRYLDQLGAKYKHLEFGDHHSFSALDCQNILSLELPVLTTEKDYVRLSPQLKEVHFLPISVRFLGDEDRFKEIISNHLIRQNNV
jgi:tetraacyldisaccharide 4'-kinase